MTDKFIEDIIWDCRKTVNLKKVEASVKTPCVVKLTQECRLGSSLPAALREEALLLHSVVASKKVLCECGGGSGVSDGRRTGQRPTQLSIPFAYRGLVEVLSENGESTSPLTTIAEVAKVAPKAFLLRSRLTVLSDVKTPTSARLLERGAILQVKGVVKLTKNKTTASYMHCTDDSGLYVYADFAAAGTFSPLAGPKNIAGVHTIESVVKNFRLPLSVRIVSGKIPREACQAGRPGVLRLREVRKEKVAMFLPLNSTENLVPVPSSKDVTLIRPANMKELGRSHVFEQLSDFCSAKVENFSKTIRVIVGGSSGRFEGGCRSSQEEQLFRDVDAIYPHIRRGGIPEGFRTQSLHEESQQTLIKPYTRSVSQPVLDRASSTMSSHFRQHTVSSPTRETTIQFQSTSGTLTLAKRDILQQFIKRHSAASPTAPTAPTAPHSKPDQPVRSALDSNNGSNEDVYFTLDNPDYTYNSVVGALPEAPASRAVR